MERTKDEERVFDNLYSLIATISGAKYAETRYHCRIINEVNFSNGEIELIRNVSNSGCGIRVLVDGCWGFTSTSNISKEALKNALYEAISIAKLLSGNKKKKVEGLAEVNQMARGRLEARVKGDLKNIDFDQKIKITKNAEQAARTYSEKIKSASCVYREILDHKIILNTDGAEVELYDSKPEFNVTTIAVEGTESATISEGIGITGGWEDLFAKHDPLDYGIIASEKAVKLLNANHVSGESTTIILDPGMVGLIAHEAIGHMAEADFVLSGSLVNDKIGEKVASDLVTIIDSGESKTFPQGAGTIAVDDEGVRAENAVIIENGYLESFLHNRESAFVFDTNSTGNARAYEYDDDPLIRMRNTFLEPRCDTLDDMLKETKHGYLLKGARNGQADANGEFMFAFQEAYLIEKGEIKELLKGASVSGRAFDVLRSVDMVGKDFAYDMGTGYCGKIQPMKVDGGGPHIRCFATVGGLQ
ncbi:MAG TPA: TldD/PmbA family protein [Candidatus Nitrosopolaris sp.]|nr:TldD/PmbA family protein [Candidatus Nitrosopolaris sp.]